MLTKDGDKKLYGNIKGKTNREIIVEFYEQKKKEKKLRRKKWK